MADEYQERRPDDRLRAIEDVLESLDTEYDNRMVSHAYENLQRLQDDDDIQNRQQYLIQAEKAIERLEDERPDDFSQDDYDDLLAAKDEISELREEYGHGDERREAILATGTKMLDHEREGKGLGQAARDVSDELLEKGRQAYRKYVLHEDQ